MPEFEGQTAIVTGANSGVGRSATELLAASGARVVMVCRSPERGERARDAIAGSGLPGGVELEITDLADLSQVRALADRLAARLDRLDILVNNAGVWSERRKFSPDGFELTFATNHLAHFLLTLRLLDALRAGRGRVINVSSEGHRRGKLRRASLEEIARGEAWGGGVQAYGDSKLANVLFTFELARRHGGEGITANALHPGVLATRIWNQSVGPISLLMRPMKLFMAKPAVGGKAVLRLASPDMDGVSGRYFEIEKEAEPQPQARDEALARELWELSERLVGLA